MNRIDIDAKYVSHFGSEKLISQVAGQSRDSAHGPSIENLLAWGHLSPFEFASMTFFISCPIYVARQVMRHRTGKYMEKSLRYTEPDDEVYIIDLDCGDKERNEVLNQSFKDYYESLFRNYHKLIESGMPKEQARGVLPLATFTHFYMQMDVRNLINFFLLRLSPDTQAETRFLAELMLTHFKKEFPTVGTYISNKLKENSNDNQ
jgi:thymidylate synthase (FAD)